MLKVALSCTRCKQLGGQIISACMPGLPGCQGPIKGPVASRFRRGAAVKLHGEKGKVGGGLGPITRTSADRPSVSHRLDFHIETL